MSGILQTALPMPLYSRGKVRDTYRLNADELLMVATDRISAFDVVLPTAIPEKGRVLTQLSRFWFERARSIVPNHVAPAQEIPAEVGAALPDAGQRSMRVLAAEPIPYECVVRGYLAGSGWKEYREQGTVAGERLPAGLRDGDRLPQPIFTPATKAITGHDENISRAELAARTGKHLAAELERLSLAVYEMGAAHSLQKGLILADTKLEFGIRDGSVILIDELLTPDSSRFWDLDTYAPGQSQPSFDKQYLRDYLETLDWNKQPPGPALPDEVVAGTSGRYLEALARLTEQRVPR